ncbi:uncharacterized protein LOC116203908 [Punica granatum]|uniref:Uncharacterized protein n=2 Tax=Punica granatum TaxID=22663 RepID=A0A218XK34_PUNGR|nr:uncharacterized protein LOC116203908 [Punica granatum]OWM85317.1 hypothetical protein CDL15_Pgr028104 [Punica granatum]PKI50960.1 hypothetical protein CRG98_028690 [Punica granatum]
MPQTASHHRRDRRSIKYRWEPPEGATFELAELVQEECVPNLTEAHKNRHSSISQPRSSKILTTPELLSVVGHVLDYTGRSLSFLQYKDNLNDKVNSCQQEDILDHLKWERDCSAAGLVKNKSLHSSSSNHLLSMVQPNLDFLRVLYGVSALKSGNESYSHSLLRRFLARGTSMPIEPWEGKGLSTLEISYRLGDIYGWMSELVPARVKSTANTAVDEGQRAANYFSGVTNNGCKDYRLGEGSSEKFLGHVDADSSISSVQSKDLASAVNVESEINTRHTASLHSDYHLQTTKSLEADSSASNTSSSNLYSDYHLHALAFRSTEYDRRSWNTESYDIEGRKEKCDNLFVDEDYKMKTCLPKRAKVDTASAKQEHAFAGAFAGIFVSLCLHPVDTVKTVVQSCRAEEKSLFYIGRSIVSERGLTGLYRGISSNIASSAPVSAIYIFTYESVKGALLPHFPKEYYSVAHCLAGGCASVATSFVFTPSERIKQQLQVGSHYHNCWDALVGIIRKGGLPSLYAGWGAVLCRNIPHSVIKFYTYETLKEWMLSSVQPAGQPSTLQTLVCGGLAGSTAALFTTPFDVVKTRLQTQKPGSVCQYDGVFHALREISTREGLKGLYRGLTPRLVMYITQGALFFASYEFFKSLFNLNEPRLNNGHRVQRAETKEGLVRPIDLPFRSPSSSAEAASSS